ncbi:hypothetical protein Daus18300_014174 [Diaporthe australafricana]|uniref:Uncharacterized protein n=1 Tax=Diaporthe australafricana TaxID=127596 RepID=A0ABR3VW86_9PEZI
MAAAPSHPRSTLRTHLPRAGFYWPDRASLLAQDRQDRAVLDVLRDHGGVASLQVGARGSARHDIEQAFVTMFEMAEADAVAERIDQFDTPLDWVADLRERLSWGGYLDEDLFIDLFLRLRRARQDWHANPREPFNTREHGRLAHAIDAFHQAASADWMDAYEELFRGVLPPVIEQAGEIRLRPRRVGVDPAAAAAHTQGTAASSAAGEPHPQTQTALGGVQEEDENEDEDVEMQEEEVEEVRERLAHTHLGEEEDENEDENEDEDVEMEME